MFVDKLRGMAVTEKSSRMLRTRGMVDVHLPEETSGNVCLRIDLPEGRE